MFEDIVLFLTTIELNKGISYEKWFPEHNPTIFKRLREVILIPKQLLLGKRSHRKYLLIEIGIEPFFESDH